MLVGPSFLLAVQPSFAMPDISVGYPTVHCNVRLPLPKRRTTRCAQAVTTARLASVGCDHTRRKALWAALCSSVGGKLLVPSGLLISITSTPTTPLGMPVSINRNTQRIDDPQVNIS